MTKKTGLYLLIGGAAVSLYDAFSGGSLYGAGKPLEKFRWKVYTTAAGNNYYVSISDVAAVVGAFVYFTKKG
jgi:hypothetical protein